MGDNRTIHFVSLGCAKNRVDTEVMLGVSDQSGFELVEDPAEAEVIVINTCGFIGPAKEESIDTILEMSAHKESGTCDKLVVAGPPDLREKESEILAYKNDKEALETFMGEKGIFLRVLSVKNGQVLSEGPLDAMPVFDGMSAAQGRIFVSLKNGQLQCWQ